MFKISDVKYFFHKIPGQTGNWDKTGYTKLGFLDNVNRSFPLSVHIHDCTDL